MSTLEEEEDNVGGVFLLLKFSLAMLPRLEFAASSMIDFGGIQGTSLGPQALSLPPNSSFCVAVEIIRSAMTLTARNFDRNR